MATADVRTLGDHVVITAIGEFDLTTAQTLRAALITACKAHQSVVLDMKDATFVEVVSLGVILAANTRLRSRGCRLLVTGPPRTLVGMVRLLELGAVLRVQGGPHWAGGRAPRESTFDLFDDYFNARAEMRLMDSNPALEPSQWAYADELREYVDTLERWLVEDTGIDVSTLRSRS